MDQVATTPRASETTPSRAWYSAPLAEFLTTDKTSVMGALSINSIFGDDPAQKQAWLAEIEFLQAHLRGLSGTLFLEFNIPRMGRRIDAVLLAGPVVFTIEFKVGEMKFDREAREQVWDYALDLKNFHEASHPLSIVPILVATEATGSPLVTLHADDDKVYRPVSVHPERFR